MIVPRVFVPRDLEVVVIRMVSVLGERSWRWLRVVLLLAMRTRRKIPDPASAIRETKRARPRRRLRLRLLRTLRDMFWLC
ncbi:MAG: hypothetical protein M0008_05190 [Actinomycetota bacterium]|nr:hypothetical protein [Actinomycetota bacterium]